jgi:hypothetical protein
MQTNQRRIVVNKFPLRLMPSVRKDAEEYSQKEGVSLNQFINLAVAEKLVHLQHESWLANRPQPTAAVVAKGLAVLDRPCGNAPEGDDALPQGYISIREPEACARTVVED